MRLNSDSEIINVMLYHYKFNLHTQTLPRSHQMRLFRSLLLSTTVLSASVATAEADINVVASIKPVHSLVAAVMEGVGTPSLIVEGAGSPHTYALKPSQAGNLQNADLVFWIGDRLETFLEKPIASIATKAKSVTLI